MERQILAASNFNQIIESLQQHESETKNLIHTITYNPQAQTIIIKMKDTLGKEADSVQASRTRPSAPIKLSEEEELKRLSRLFTDKFPELTSSFQAWEPRRVDLIKKSEASANNLQWNVLLCSMSRIFSSSADLVGTWMRSKGSETSWVQLSLELAPIVTFASLFVQAVVSSRILKTIRASVKKDEELFQPIQTWFQQSQELDTAVKNFFPYGIDRNIVSEIEQNAQAYDESAKIFMSVIASNVKKNSGLLQDRDFLSKADMFSVSEAGEKWYQKILIEMDPFHIECLKCDLENQIKEVKSSHTISDPEKIFYGSLPMHYYLATSKVILNGLAIFSAVSSMWNEKSIEDAETLKKLSEKAKKELDAMQKVYNLLKPSHRLNSTG